MEDIYCFAGNPLDRVSERRRDREWIGTLLADPGSRILPLYDLKPAIQDMARPALEWEPLAPWREHVAAGATRNGSGRCLPIPTAASCRSTT